MMRALISFLFLFSLWFLPVAHGEVYAEGETVKVKILDVRVTQFAVGEREVEARKEKLQAKDESGDLKDYKKEKAGRAVIGPDGALYLIDGHHLARALDELEKTSMWVTIEKDYSNLSVSEFWSKMQKKNFCYLSDENGKTKSPSSLPKTVRGLRNDPYRSLAWLVRKADGYDAEEAPFQEFYWADFFRTRVRLSANSSKASWKQAIKEALDLAASNKAKDLPGWHGEKGDCAKALRQL